MLAWMPRCTADGSDSLRTIWEVSDDCFSFPSACRTLVIYLAC